MNRTRRQTTKAAGFNPNEAIYHGEAWAGYAEATDAVYRVFQKLSSPPLLLGPRL